MKTANPRGRLRASPGVARMHSALYQGGMGERTKPPVLKTGERKLRGFESHSLRQDGPRAALLDRLS